ncbi:MAG: hypothetical protein GY732_20770 [Gammaproteobacteria bacterium]|nr:hypothetical protein [Gammaproteobacteria bacterium]
MTGTQTSNEEVSELSPIFRKQITKDLRKLWRKQIKKTIISALVTGVLFLAGSSNIVAQDDEMLVIPVELFTCNYNDGQDPDDRDKALANTKTAQHLMPRTGGMCNSDS